MGKTSLGRTSWERPVQVGPLGKDLNKNLLVRSLWERPPDVGPLKKNSYYFVTVAETQQKDQLYITARMIHLTMSRPLSLCCYFKATVSDTFMIQSFPRELHPLQAERPYYRLSFTHYSRNIELCIFREVSCNQSRVGSAGKREKKKIYLDNMIMFVGI